MLALKSKDANINPSCKGIWWGGELAQISFIQADWDPAGQTPSSPELSMPALSLKDNLQYEQRTRVISLYLLKPTRASVLRPALQLNPQPGEIPQL